MNDTIKQFSFQNENKVEIKIESQPDFNTGTINRKESDINKTSKVRSDPLRLNFTQDDENNESLLQKLLKMKNEKKT